MPWVGELGILSLNRGYELDWFVGVLYGVFVTSCFYWLISLLCRLLLQDKRTLGRSNVSFSGHMHREHCMGCNHLTQRCLLNERISQNSIKWLKKPKEEQKLQGRPQSYQLAVWTWHTKCFRISYQNKRTMAIVLKLFLHHKNNNFKVFIFSFCK